MKRGAAFTLIELLVTVSLVALIGMCLFAMFSSAINMMQRISRTIVMEDVNIFLEKMDRDVTSQAIFNGIPFEGKEDSVSFPLRMDANKQNPMDKGIGSVTYFYDDFHQTIERSQKNANQIYEEKEVKSKTMLEGVMSVQFQYFVYDKVEKTYGWTEEWNSLEKEGAIPFAVQIDFECTKGEETYALKRTFPIPVADSKR